MTRIPLALILILSFGAFAKAQTSSVTLTAEVRIGQGNFSERLPLEIRDPEIYSPKSARFSANGKKLYINSLEGGKTVVYSWPQLKKLKSISHRFTAKNSSLFFGETTVFGYPYLSVPPSGDQNQFMGKPVESELSADGKYLWVPYYRRDWDLSAQSPSAVAIIDTETDQIVRVMPTGPIPKYVVASPDGRYMAIIHWGDNTVALIDVSSGDPARYQYVSHMTVENQLDQQPLTGTDRDDTCGFCLRGSVFSSDSQYLIVGRMGKGGIAGFHIPSRRYLGSIMNVASTPRHLVLGPDGDTLYVSSNWAGAVSKTSLQKVLASLESAQGRRIPGPSWKSASIGKGARTLALSPDGRLLFVAMNDSAEVVTLDSQSLTVLNRRPVDPYSVGLAVSPDGQAVVVTSQGHSGHGGNSVNIFSVHVNETSPAISLQGLN